MKKYVLLTVLFLLFSGELFSARITFDMPRNLDFELSAPGYPADYWLLPESYAEVGYGFVADEFKPSSGNLCGRLFIREHLDSTVGFGLVHQRISAERYRGKKVRFKADLRGIPMNDTSRVSAFISIKTATEEFIFEQKEINLDPPVEWKTKEIQADVPLNAIDISYGLMLAGMGDAYIDNTEFDFVQSRNAELVNESAIKLSDETEASLIDFARFYGLMRFYSPATEALFADWDAALLSGIKKISEGIEPSETGTFLKNHFKYVNPLITVGEDALSYEYERHPDADSLIAFSMLHVGAYSPAETDYFGSQYRLLSASTRDRDGVLMHIDSVENLTGKTIEFSALVRQNALDMSAGAQLKLRVDRELGYVQSKRESEIIRGNCDKKKLSIKVKIREDDVVALRLGLVAIGETEVYFDDIKVTVLETGEELTVKDAGAENAKLYPEPEQGWYYPVSVKYSGYIVEITDDFAFEGNSSFRIKADPTGYPRPAQPGDTYTFKTSDGTPVVFPTALHGSADSTRSLPECPAPGDAYYFPGKPKGFVPTAEDVYSRIAVLTDTYAYLHHFGQNLKNYEELDAAFISAVKKANDEISEDEFNDILDEFISIFERPRLFVFAGRQKENLFSLPFRFQFTDGGIPTVIQSADSAEIPNGSRILELGGKDVEDIFSSGDGAYYMYRNRDIAGMYRAGDKESKIKIKYRTPDGDKKEKEFVRSIPVQEILETRPPIFYPFNDSTFYIDLTAIDDKLLMENRAKLQEYDNIIFDCRGDIDVNPHAFGLFNDKPVSGISRVFDFYTDPYNNDKEYKKYGMSIKGHDLIPNKNIYLLADERSVGMAGEFIRTARMHNFAKIYGSPVPPSGDETLYYYLPGNYILSFPPGKSLMPDGSNALDTDLMPDVRVEFNEGNAARYLPYINEVLSDIESN